MTTVIDQRVKIFLESWNLHGGELDTKASCQVCGGEIKDGKFALVNGILICLACKEKDQ